MRFSSNLKKIMHNKHMSYEKLQGFAQISPQSVARASDHRISTCTLKILGKIAAALDVQVKDLFDEVPPQN
ncbi:MAG: helix-turn-helix transcriptional regulator [Desulfovibrio sp.]|jgi:DNA-binding Xre family transcriptional regulator|nr:helix-turn-helix transcriptional regulator [Desulfovibrio sp.]